MTVEKTQSVCKAKNAQSSIYIDIDKQMQSPVWAGFMKVSFDCATAMTFDFLTVGVDFTEGAVEHMINKKYRV